MKIKIILCILLMHTLHLVSQNNFGVFGGLNTSTVVSTGQTSYGVSLTRAYSFSFHLGVLYETELHKNIHFSPRLVYSQLGDRDNSDEGASIFNGVVDGIDDYTINYKLNYLNIPLNFKFYNETYILAGPQIGFLLSNEKTQFDVGDPKTIDIGFNIGIGRKINNFFLELNLYHAVTPFLEYTNNITIGDFKGYNASVQFSIGYNL